MDRYYANDEEVIVNPLFVLKKNKSCEGVIIHHEKIKKANSSPSILKVKK